MGMICCIHTASEAELKSFQGNEDALFDFMEEAEDCMDFDKSWHAIHFLLTDSAWKGDAPLNFIVSGGEPIEGSDTGYGEARFFTPDEISEVAEVLNSISEEELMSRFDSDKMKSEEIYPEIWDRPEEEEDNKEYILENFRELKQFLPKIVADKKHMIISIQ